MDGDRARFMRDEGIELVLDVGANEGQYAQRLRSSGYSGDIVSFEPLVDAHERLQQAAHSDPRWRAENFAIGRARGRALINVSANSYSSSLLDLTAECLDAAPEAAYRTKQEVNVQELEAFDFPAVPLMLKADVQGTEPEVLRGATRLLRRVRLLELELSLRPLYAGQMLAHDVCALAREHGFVPVAVGDPFRHPETAEILSLDALFRRV